MFLICHIVFDIVVDTGKLNKIQSLPGEAYGIVRDVDTFQCIV